MPCSVVYQETVASKQLAMKKCTFCERAPTDTKRFLRSIFFLNPEKLEFAEFASGGSGSGGLPESWLLIGGSPPFLSGCSARESSTRTRSVSCRRSIDPLEAAETPLDTRGDLPFDPLCPLDPFATWFTCCGPEWKLSAD